MHKVYQTLHFEPNTLEEKAKDIVVIYFSAQGEKY